MVHAVNDRVAFGHRSDESFARELYRTSPSYPNTYGIPRWEMLNPAMAAVPAS